ncbi:exported hypothetical protein [metagenome]|uniref:Uncharacterized protein n=1 Tax=metagenome TaxID=256318 RepID=A0A2P2C8D9_9ZZZZ
MNKLIALVVGALCLSMAPALSVEAAPAPASKPAFRVNASVSKHLIISSQTVVVTGTVRPLSIGSKVILQKQYRKTGKWKRVETRVIDAAGRFTLTDRPSTGKTRWYRVVKPAGAGRSRGVSDRMKVAVEPWDGRVRATLFWDGTPNLNLTVFDSNFDTISEDSPGPTDSGGQMSANSTIGCGSPGAHETAYWPNADAPFGHYYVEVVIPDDDPCGGTDLAWRLEVRVNGRLVKTVRGNGTDYYVYTFGQGARAW